MKNGWKLENTSQDDLDHFWLRVNHSPDRGTLILNRGNLWSGGLGDYRFQSPAHYYKFELTLCLYLAALSSLNVTGIQTTPSSAGRQYALPSTLVVAGSPTGLMDAKWLTNLWWSEMKEIRHLDLYIFDIGPFYLSLGWYLGWPLLWQIPPLAFKDCQAQKRPEHGDFLCAQLISNTSKGGRAV